MNVPVWIKAVHDNLYICMATFPGYFLISLICELTLYTVLPYAEGIAHCLCSIEYLPVISSATANR